MFLPFNSKVQSGLARMVISLPTVLDQCRKRSGHVHTGYTGRGGNIHFQSQFGFCPNSDQPAQCPLLLQKTQWVKYIMGTLDGLVPFISKFHSLLACPMLLQKTHWVKYVHTGYTRRAGTINFQSPFGFSPHGDQHVHCYCRKRS